MTKVKVILSQQNKVLTDTTRCKSLVHYITGDLGELTSLLLKLSTCQTLHQVMMGSSHNPPLTVPDRDFFSPFPHRHLVQQDLHVVLLYLPFDSFRPSLAWLIGIAVGGVGAESILHLQQCGLVHHLLGFVIGKTR